MKVQRFRMRPETFEAVCWNGDNTTDVVQWLQGGWATGGVWLKQHWDDGNPKFTLMIPGADRDAEIKAEIGDWIIKTGSFGQPIVVMSAKEFTAKFEHHNPN